MDILIYMVVTLIFSVGDAPFLRELPTCNPHNSVRLIRYFHSVLQRVELSPLPHTHQASPGQISPKNHYAILLCNTLGWDPSRGIGRDPLL